jgi:hypothetical protein
MPRPERPREEPGLEAHRICEGLGCQEWVNVRYDPVARRWLCQRCWAKVDPRNHGGSGGQRAT